jgi:autotransporter-associated beta strand protein
VCHWTGTADNKWSNSRNWDSAPQAGDALVFQGMGITAQNDLTDRTTFESIRFASNGFTLTGNTIWVNNGITVASGVANATISLGVALGGAVTVDVADVSSSLTVSAALSAGGSLAKAGDGTLILSGTNTYTGGTTIDNGTVMLGNDNALGAAVGTIDVNGSNASLNLNGYCPVVGKVILTDGSIVPGSGTATLTATSYTVMKGAISANLAGDGGFTKITNDLVILSGANTFSGLTTVSAGELQMIGSNAWNTVFNMGGANIQGGKLVLDYTNGSSPASSVLSILEASYGDGSNPFSVDNGAKIYNSTAKDTDRVLAWVDDSVNRVTIMSTLRGDVDLNGTVDVTDLSLLASHWSAAAAWAQGDFNYDRYTNVSDLALLAQNFSRSVAQPSLALSGTGRVNEGAPYTLTFGEVAGVTAQSYTIDWGDGTSPEICTAAQIEALNRQVIHTYANGVSSPIITVGLTDDEGGVYCGTAAKVVAVNTVSAPVSAAPAISNFYCISEYADIWTLTGTVTDKDDPIAGYTITFGGVLAGYNLTTTVGADGVFTLTVELHGLQSGTGTAQTPDPHGVLSNNAGCWIMV